MQSTVKTPITAQGVNLNKVQGTRILIAQYLSILYIILKEANKNKQQHKNS